MIERSTSSLRIPLDCVYILPSKILACGTGFVHMIRRGGLVHVASAAKKGA